MSARIEQIISVLRIVKRNFRNPTDDLVKLRIAAGKEVAKSFDCDETTVSNKFRREIGIAGTAAFDDLCSQWFRHSNNILENILLDHAGGTDDTNLIRDFFRNNPT